MITKPSDECTEYEVHNKVRGCFSIHSSTTTITWVNISLPLFNTLVTNLKEMQMEVMTRSEIENKGVEYGGKINRG